MAKTCDMFGASLWTLVFLLVALRSIDCRTERYSNSKNNIQDGGLSNLDHSDSYSVKSNYSSELDALTDSIVEIVEDGSDSGSRRHRYMKRPYGGRHFEYTQQDGGSDDLFDWTRDDFVMTDSLPDGENEKRIQFGGISAKETSVARNGVGLVLRQLTDGQHFVQTISNIAGEIVDCEYIEDDTTVRKFLKDFKKDLSSTFTKKNKKNQKGGTRKEKRKKYLSKMTRKQQNPKNNKRQNAEKKSRILKKELDDYTDLYNNGEWDDFNGGVIATVADYNYDSSDDESENIPYGAEKLENFEVLQQDQAVFRDDYKIAFNKLRTKRDRSDYYDFQNAQNLSKFDSVLRFGRKRNLKPRVLAKRDFDSRDDSLRNVTVLKLVDGSKLPDDVAEWLDIKVLEERCDGVHRQLKQSLGMNEDAENIEMQDEGTLERSKRSLLIAPGMLWCGAGQLAESPSELGELGAPDACCRAHDLCPGGGVPGLGRRNGLVNMRPFTVSRCRCDRSRDAPATARAARAARAGRAGRRARSTGMLVPGTVWCGRGGSASRYAQLGAFDGADRCCRAHDTSCPFWLGAAETKYGLFNWRPNTLMHCRCDERFRACLKLANTDAANMVGRLFFNVVQTKCFVLKPAKVCLHRSWWGKCLKMGVAKQAHLRDNPAF